MIIDYICIMLLKGQSIECMFASQRNQWKKSTIIISEVSKLE